MRYIECCIVCGCLYHREYECPVCKLRNDLPSILDDLKDRIEERRIYPRMVIRRI